MDTNGRDLLFSGFEPLLREHSLSQAGKELSLRVSPFCRRNLAHYRNRGCITSSRVPSDGNSAGL
jgi:hypothetical protein